MSREGSHNAGMAELFSADLNHNVALLDGWLVRGFVHDGSDAPEEVQRALHSVSGAARVLGVASLSPLLEAAEKCASGWGELSLARARDAFELFATLRNYLAHVAQSASSIEAIQTSTTEQEALADAFEKIYLVNTTPANLAPTILQKNMGPQIDSTLLEIFRIEVATCVAALSNGLIVLDTGTPSPAVWADLMRTAHSLKGAARIVNLNALAQLAHALEDCLVLAQAGNLTLTSSDIDLLLKATDTVKECTALICDGVPNGHMQAEAKATAISARLSQLTSGEQSAKRSKRPQDPALTHMQTQSAYPDDDALTVLTVPPLATTIQKMPSNPPTLARSSPPTSAQLAAPKEAQERVLRVAADSINALIGLAGESSVEARRVAAFSMDLAHLKKQETVLAELINSIEILLRNHPDGVAKHLVLDAKTQARECLRLLGEHGVNFELYARRAEQLGERIYREALKSRMRPFSDGTQGLSRLVRDLSRDLGKRARIEIAGEHTEVDRDVLERLDAPLNHLLRNAIDHGLETSSDRIAKGKTELATVRVEARHHAGMLSIVVGDDGKGIDVEAIRKKTIARGLASPSVAALLSRAELLDFLFLPGFSTAAAVSEISGRGVGLDVVKHTVESLGGTVRITSELGQGTAFHLQLPVTRSVIRAMVAEIHGHAYAFPLLRIRRIDRLPHSAVKTLENRQYVMIDNRAVSLMGARHILSIAEARSEKDDLKIVVVNDRDQYFGIVVDDFRGEQDLVVRPLDPRLGKIQNISAAAILLDGSVALIVDVDDMMRSIDRLIQEGAGAMLDMTKSLHASVAKRILVVDDSITVREAERQLLSNRGYAVDVAVDGMEGLSCVRQHHYDLVITDIDMPRMNGIELVRAIKQDAKLGSIPVVVVSYKDRAEDRMRGLEAGANYYITKSSFHDDKLIEAVEDLIGDVAPS